MLGHLGIRVIMDVKVRHDVPALRRLQIGLLVSFSGELIGIKEGVAVVALDDLACLP